MEDEGGVVPARAPGLLPRQRDPTRRAVVPDDAATVWREVERQRAVAAGNIENGGLAPEIAADEGDIAVLAVVGAEL